MSPELIMALGILLWLMGFIVGLSVGWAAAESTHPREWEEEIPLDPIPDFRGYNASPFATEPNPLRGKAPVMCAECGQHAAAVWCDVCGMKFCADHAVHGAGHAVSDDAKPWSINGTAPANTIELQVSTSGLDPAYLPNPKHNTTNSSKQHHIDVDSEEDVK